MLCCCAQVFIVIVEQSVLAQRSNDGGVEAAAQQIAELRASMANPGAPVWHHCVSCQHDGGQCCSATQFSSATWPCAEQRGLLARQLCKQCTNPHALHCLRCSLDSCCPAGTTGEDVRRSVRVGKLNLVDLAGSERVHITGATGEPPWHTLHPTL
jgi:hypothetical protein